jgi:hypothetical protein
MRTITIFLGVFLFFNAPGQVKVSPGVQQNGVSITVANYNSVPVYSSAVTLDAEEIYGILGKAPGSSLKAFVSDTKESVPLVVCKSEGKNIIRLYLSLKSYQALKLQLVPATGQKQSTDRFINWNKENHNGTLSNGVIKLRFRDDKWDLIVDGSAANSNIAETGREVLINGCYYGWLDSISRGRVSDTRSFKPSPGFEPVLAGPDGKGMMSTRKAKIENSSVSAKSSGDVELVLKKRFSGFAKDIDYIETYTLMAGNPILKYSLKFINNGKDTVYVGYVGRGGFVYAKYGKNFQYPLMQNEKTKNGNLNAKSETIRVAWMPQPIWAGLESDNGMAVIINSLIKYPGNIMKGSMVWQFSGDAFEMPLVEHSQGQYPFRIAPGKIVESGLYITATSGGIPASVIAKNISDTFAGDSEIKLVSSLSVFYEGEVKQFATISDFANLNGNNKNNMAGVSINFDRPYQLTISVSDLPKGKNITYQFIPLDKTHQSISIATFSSPGQQIIDINAVTRWKGYHSFVLKKSVEEGLPIKDNIFLSPKPFSPVEISSPPDQSEITDIATFYRWKISPDAQSYELQFCGKSDFKNVETITIDGGNNNFYLPKDLPKDGRHFWRVRATAPKLKGEWSKACFFTTNSIHSVLPVQRKVSTDHPLFTIETGGGTDLSKMTKAIPADLKEYFAIVVGDKNNVSEILSPARKANMSVLLRTHHPSPLNDWQSLAIVEKIFKEFPNVIGIQGGESLGAWYGKGDDARFINRLIKLCAKYGKIIHEGDGCYDENKWLEIYKDSLTRNIISKYKSNIIFSQKNNIFNKQLFTQSALFGHYLAGTVENTGAWEDGGWYWAQVGFKKLGQSFGARTGELFDMPPIFWDLTFLMGLARGATVFSMDGQGGVFMRGHYDPANPKHHNQVLWSSEGDATETFTRFVIPFLRGVVNHKMFVTKNELLDKVKIAVTYKGVDEIKDFKEDRYQEFWPMFKGTYGFSTQGTSKGEVYEYFPNTGRYFFIPVLPPVAGQLPDKITRLAIKELQDPLKVTEMFNAKYPETYEGDALVYQVGDIIAVMNTHENDDVTETYSVPVNRGIFSTISGKIGVHSYLMGKFENNNSQLWLQINTNYSERNTAFRISCTSEPKVKVNPAEAIKTCRWEPSKKELIVELEHKMGAVELTIGK